ncbi:MAG TPA: CHAT domain-containing protein [Thermoanaerobaculia bacterium]|nr:CHAT domain-containing protein [Thermoanaerobaculia bacterium]
MKMIPIRRPRIPLRISILAILLPEAALFAGNPASIEPENGAIVERVAKGMAAQRAGIQPGDLLLSWSCKAGNSGLIRSPFDLDPIEIEQAPHCEITLQGIHAGESQEWTLLPGRWGLETRPTFPGPLFALYEQGRERITNGDFAAGIERYREALAASDRGSAPLRTVWLQIRWSRELAAAGRWSDADAIFEAAIQRLNQRLPAGQPTVAQVLRDHDWIEALLQHNLWDRAEERLRRALALEPEESLGAAWDLGSLGVLAEGRGDYASAENLLRRAYAIQEKLAPGSAWMIQKERGRVAFRRGDLDAEEKILSEELKTQERLAPESFRFAVILSELGKNASAKGDLVTAAERLQRTLPLLERWSPDSLEFANVLAQLAHVDLDRGDLANAEERFRRALTLTEELAPQSFYAAYYTNQLAFLAQLRGDRSAAEEHFRNAVHISEKLAHSSPPSSYNNVYYRLNLAAIEKLRGNLVKADEYLQGALEIQARNRRWPEGYDIAGTCFNRAQMAIERGDLALAERMHSRALTILEKQSPGSLVVSDSLDDLGTVAFERGHLSKARNLFRRALAIREKLAPGSARVGLSINHLGLIDRREGNLARAAEHFCRATEIFDQQRKMLGGTPEEKSAFGGSVEPYYQDCVAALIELGRLEEAFGALERGRARSFLDLLAEREMHLAELPSGLARDRKQIDAEYDRTQAALTRLSPRRDEAEIDRLLVRLREIQARQEELAAQVRLISPRAANLHRPKPLDLAHARAALDPGTVLLEYAVGPKRTWLFVVEAPSSMGSGLTVHQIAAGKKRLSEPIENFRHLLEHPGSDPSALKARAQQLYKLLVRPAAHQIARAHRILVSPDGPLHTVPFATLMRGGHYLIEWRPVHTVLSATVYAEIARSRPAHRDPAKESFVAFGDPVYPAGATTDPEVRETLRRGFGFKSLPATRREVESIARLYPQSQTYLAREATEERAKSIEPGSQIVHFACHGLLDERFPLNSALALTLPEHPAEGQENGLLQAWEIFESVRLDADLVTLSACNSGLGKEMGGEGLVGLVRAFQFAGARSVLASLWSVADVSTARFMESFYGHLHDGLSKDEALRAAQLDMIREKSGSSHPFHWAAFELFGDWR